MTRKRFVKILMSCGNQRNFANEYADYIQKYYKCSYQSIIDYYYSKEYIDYLDKIFDNIRIEYKKENI